MKDRKRGRNKRAICSSGPACGTDSMKFRRLERTLQFIRQVIEILTECEGLFAPLQNLLGHLMITVATICGLAYVLGLLIR